MLVGIAIFGSVVFFLFDEFMSLSRGIGSTSIPPSPVGTRCEAFRRTVSDVNTTIDSTILMLYDATDAPGYTYVYPNASRGTARTSFLTSQEGCTRLDDESYSSSSFKRVVAAFLSSPYPMPSVDATNPFYDFFNSHHATFWVVNETGVASPLKLDVVYTYVNSAASSFRVHMAVRGIPFSTERRYNDWEELRYSLRTLYTNVLQSRSLQQDITLRAAEDEAMLKAMGYHVEESTTPSSSQTDGKVMSLSPLVRRVYLVVSNEDQVPAWMDPANFPQLQIVTHPQLFNHPEDADILPTLNSNCIESALHRIPGLSRFHLYVNNDHLIGRTVSLFDLFRPLSPLRQSLHLASQEVRGGRPVAAAPCAEHLPRRYAFMEPLLHSESAHTERHRFNSRESDYQSKVRAQELQCLNYEAHVGAQVLQKRGPHSREGEALWAQGGWTTRPSFTIPEPPMGSIQRGLGVFSPYYYHVVTNTTDGIRPPWGYAHIAMVMDRLVSYRLWDVDMADLSNRTRHAYEREMHPFSGVDVFAPYSVTIRRATVRAEWQSLMQATQHPLRKRLAQRLSAHVAKMGGVRTATRRHLQMEDLGPLYRDTWGANLQSPDLPEELAYWWLPEARPAYHSSTDVGPLEHLYHIPYINKRFDRTQVYARQRDGYFAVYFDLFHHFDYVDRTYRFEMLHSWEKTLLVASRMHKERDTMPLWNAFNDNFSLKGADIAQLKEAFVALMRIVSGADSLVPPWERRETV